MSSLKSSLLIVGHPRQEEVSLGAEFVSSYPEVEELLEEHSFSVIAISSQSGDTEELLKLLKKIAAHSSETLTLLVSFGLPAENLKSLINSGNVFHILNDFSQPLFEHTLQRALEEYSLNQQNNQLLQLINEQNDRLKKLSIELEDRVEKRQTYLSNSKKRLLTSNHRVEALHRALIAVHRANTIGELEKLVQEALSSAIGLDWIRILFQSQSLLEEEDELKTSLYDIFSIPLVQDREHFGQIYFARAKDQPFLKDEHNFLVQVADAVALAIDRLSQLQESQTLKQQWESTFDAISSAVALIDEKYQIIRCNRAFAQQSGQPIQEIIQKHCYKSLFGEEITEKDYSLEGKFQIHKGNQHFEVSSERLPLANFQRRLYFVILRDTTEQKRLEKQVVESAKMAELGTIGSSIAHELNNPLGGIISFLQLIKMDLDKNAPFFQDIVEMEKGATHCKEIVQNLLHFSRRPSIDKVEAIRLKEIVEDAVKISELQTRSQGIHIDFIEPEDDFEIQGQFNLLVQVFCHLLQLFAEKVGQHLAENPGQEGGLKVSLKESIILIETELPIHIDKDENQEEETAGFDLSLTQQILDEHSARLEISSGPQESFQIKVYFSRPENLVKSQDFDVEL